MVCVCLRTRAFVCVCVCVCVRVCVCVCVCVVRGKGKGGRRSRPSLHGTSRCADAGNHARLGSCARRPPPRSLWTCAWLSLRRGRRSGRTARCSGPLAVSLPSRGCSPSATCTETTPRRSPPSGSPARRSSTWTPASAPAASPGGCTACCAGYRCPRTCAPCPVPTTSWRRWRAESWIRRTRGTAVAGGRSSAEP